ncbi:MAG: ABC transporter substrate-binding protein [Bacilli bacterium]
MNKKFLIFFILLICSVSLVFAAGATEKQAPKKSLSILMFSSFVAENDSELREIAKEFGEMKGIDVEVEFLGIQEMYPKLTAEVNSRSGHDIVGLENLQVSLYQNALLPINDIIEKIVDELGEFPASSITAVVRDGDWKALPWWIVPFNATYREDLFKEVGHAAPNSWDDLLVAGRALKAYGSPIGIPFGSCGDANNSLYQLMWGFGGGLADANGKIIVDSKETRNAISFAKQLYEQAMPAEVIGWSDNGANNNFLLSGVGSWSLQPISVWVTASKNNPSLAEKFNHHGALEGPAGRFGSGDFYSLGIWEFSPNADVAKEFLAYLYEKQIMNRYLTSGKGFNLPTHSYYYDHEIFSHPKLQGLKGYADAFRTTGFPAPPDQRAQDAYQRWVVPNLFYKVVSGRVPMDQAINETVKELLEIGYTR